MTITTPDAYNRIVAASMKEDELLSHVIDMAHQYGYLVFHPRPAMKKDGTWYTATQGDKGYFDLTLIRCKLDTLPWLIFAELKSEKGRLFGEQVKWKVRADLLGLKTHGYVAYHLWRPSDLLSGHIEQNLRGEE